MKRFYCMCCKSSCLSPYDLQMLHKLIFLFIPTEPFNSVLGTTAAEDLETSPTKELWYHGQLTRQQVSSISAGSILADAMAMENDTVATRIPSISLI